MLKGIDQIYIAHYSPLIERKVHIQSELNKYNLSAIFVEDEPSQFEISKYYSKSIHEFNMKMNAMPENVEHRILKYSEISLAYKHVKIYEHIKRAKNKVSLILEDDVVLCNNFDEQIEEFLTKTPNDWDMIFPGSGCNLHIPQDKIIDDQVAYKKSHPASKCTDSYLITESVANRLLSTIIPFNFPIDWELNYQMFLHNMNIYWLEPTLISQGSQNGMFRSEIQ